MDKITEINLKLELNEINTIIEALGKEPFIKVYKIIEKLHVQSNAQLRENNGNKTE